MTEAERGITLEDVEEIKQLKARYCRCVDLKRWQEFREIFADDCEFVGMASGSDGPEGFVTAVKTLVSELKSVHHVHNPEIRGVSQGRARGSWNLQDYLFWEKSAQIPPHLRGSEDQTAVIGFGFYEEGYARTPAGWKISRIRLSRIALIPLHEHRPEPNEDGILKRIWGAPDGDWLAGGGFQAEHG